MKLPKISIVTPSFNQGEYIEQTILSIINQGYSNLEYIIIDGGSTDNTVEIIKKYAKHIAYWVSEKDNGQSDAINKGLKKCTGDIFNWINSDDYLEEGALLVIGKKFLETNADILCGYTNIFNDFTNIVLQKHRTEIFANVETTIVEQKINQPAMFYNLAILKNLGGINADLHYVMDLELWFRYLCQYGQHKIILLENLLAHFRIHGKSKTDCYEIKFRDEEKSIFKYIVANLIINKKWEVFFKSKLNYFPSHDLQLKNLNVKKLANALSEKYLYLAYKCNDKKIARISFTNLLLARRISLNLQNIAMFVKLFIGDLPLRKFLKKK